jgi:hypothetical protein
MAIRNGWRTIKRPTAWSRERQAAFMLALRAENYDRLDAMSIRGGWDDDRLEWSGYDYEYQSWIVVTFEPDTWSSAVLSAGPL